MEIPMWEFLKPEYFEKLASAALEVAMPLLDDEEELKSPSNAIKLKYTLLEWRWSITELRFNENVCEKLNLKRPESITSVTLRKYTATLSQVLSLKENEIGWLCKHLGHTKSVHTEHYKQLSGYVERVEIGKLMMIQDMNLVSKFKGKDLHSVNFTDILKTDNHNIEEKQQDVYDINNDADDIDVDETVIHKEKLLKENLKKTTRVKWTTEEEEEIKKYFGNHLKVKTTPGKSECLKIIQKNYTCLEEDSILSNITYSCPVIQPVFDIGNVEKDKNVFFNDEKHYNIPKLNSKNRKNAINAILCLVLIYCKYTF
ncbi:unnamed protein product [Mytilus edulis]|uniref:Uncharacterized protein n=1 Tax=Mytilus edulis TaxID=6550 RepID=A0A8S3UNN4_MYTED|nr:unnamed protein product [Mytilus edulis]